MSPHWERAQRHWGALYALVTLVDLNAGRAPRPAGRTPATTLLLGVDTHQLNQLLKQIGKRHHLALGEIDQPGRDAVTLRPPAVLADEEAVIDTPALIGALQPPQHAHDRLDQRDSLAIRGSDRVG